LQAENLLADWVDAYDRGQRQPLLLPPDPAWAYVQAAVKDEAKARFKLEQAWDEVVADSLWRQVLSAEEQERLPEAVTGEAVKLFGPMLGLLEKGEWEGLGAVWGGVRTKFMNLLPPLWGKAIRKSPARPSAEQKHPRDRRATNRRPAHPGLRRHRQDLDAVGAVCAAGAGKAIAAATDPRHHLHQGGGGGAA
jgi:hypothetical protein